MYWFKFHRISSKGFAWIHTAQNLLILSFGCTVLWFTKSVLRTWIDMEQFDSIHRTLHWNNRLLHSPSVVAIRLSVGYETWPLIGWHHPFVTGMSRYRLALLSAILQYGLTWPVGIPTVFWPQWQSLCTAITAGSSLPLGLYRGTVKVSTETLKDKQQVYKY